MSGSIKFMIQAASLNKNGKILKDKDGFYTMPFFVFDKPSNNGKLYDTNHMVDCITNPKHRFFRTIMGNKLYGEYGHPITTDFDRLTKIKEQNHALFIKGVHTETLGDGSQVAMMRFRPEGPYGAFYAKAIEDPDMNASCSIRVVCSEGPREHNYQILYPKALITIDGVGAGGYEVACVQYAKSVHGESLGFGSYEMDLPIDKIVATDNSRDLVHMEGMTSDALKEYFQRDNVSILSKTVSTITLAPHEKVMRFYNNFIR